MKIRVSAVLVCMLAITFASLAQVPTAKPAQAQAGLEIVATFTYPMPTGVTVSQDGRVFAALPRWTDKGDYTVAEIVNGQPVPYPNADINKLNTADEKDTLVSVQSVVVDAKNRLWLLDTGSINFQPVYYPGPKLIGIDLSTNTVFKTIYFANPAIAPTSYLNDVRFDLRRGAAGMAYITDSSDRGTNAIVVVDLASGVATRRLNQDLSVEAEYDYMPTLVGQPDQPHMVRMPGQQPMKVTTGADPIALSADGSRLYYAPLTSQKLYSVSVDALSDPNMTDMQVKATVRQEGMKGYSDGIETDNQNRVYTTNYQEHAIYRGTPGGTFAPLVSDPRMVWPDTLSISSDNYLYAMTNQLNLDPRFHFGNDLRKPPYYLFRIKIDAGPVRLGQ